MPGDSDRLDPSIYELVRFMIGGGSSLSWRLAGWSRSVLFHEGWFQHLPVGEDYAQVEPHQPFFLKALGMSMKILGDPDAAIISDGKSASGGRRHGQLQIGCWHTGCPEGPVDSVVKEAELGHMEKVSVQEAVDRYGDELRAAAQGAIEKGDGPGGSFMMAPMGCRLVFSDDLLWLAQGKEGPELILVLLFVWVIVGSPVAWGKVAGGLAVDWIGFRVDAMSRPCR
eukprot:5374356-Amphidinium_carterae.1